jgi:hypothetical protein
LAGYVEEEEVYGADVKETVAALPLDWPFITVIK